MTQKKLAAAALLCIPILVGAVLMYSGGAPAARYGLHLGTGALGLLAYLALVFPPIRLSQKISAALAILGLAILASTLMDPGIQGVHRWLALGALRLHPSAILGPALLVFAAREILEGRLPLGYLVLVAVQTLHVLQPDAGQATAFGAGAILLTLAGPRRLLSLGLALFFAGSIAAAWLRPDPLPPAPFVEDIVGRAFQLAPAAGIAALLSLLPLLIAPQVAEYPSFLGISAQTALILYFGASLIAPILGEFPVPLLGFGPSPILGAFLGLALLQRGIPRLNIKNPKSIHRIESKGEVDFHDDPALLGQPPDILGAHSSSPHQELLRLLQERPANAHFYVAHGPAVSRMLWRSRRWLAGSRRLGRGPGELWLKCFVGVFL